MDKISIEMSFKIFDDETGNYIYVGPDQDGLDLIQFRSVVRGEEEASIFLSKEQVPYLINILDRLMAFNTPKTNSK